MTKLDESFDQALAQLPWNVIIPVLNRRYQVIVRETFGSNEEILNLLSPLGVSSIEYNPLGESSQPEDGEGDNQFWKDTTKNLTNLLIVTLVEEYGVPPENAKLFRVEQIASNHNVCCYEKHSCANGGTRWICCRC